MSKLEIKVLVEGGKATAGPPIGPALGPLGVNVGKIVSEINQRTKEFEGMKVPVVIRVDKESKEWEIEIGTPPTSALILKELGVEKGSGDAKANVIGSLSMEQVVKIAKLKMDQMMARDLKRACKEVIGTCLSMGVNVEGKNPKEVIKEIDEGKWDHLFK